MIFYDDEAIPVRVRQLVVNWLRERLRSPNHKWTPAERRLGNAVAKMTEWDHDEGRTRTFLVMPAKPKRKKP